MQKVDIRILEVEWLSEKNMRELFIYLANRPDEGIFANELVKVLLAKQDYSFQLITYVFLPYSAYMICVVIYFTNVITFAKIDSQDHGFFKGEDGHIALRVIIFFLSILLFGNEIFQMTYLGKRYFFDKWNWVQMISYIGNLLVIFLHAGNWVQNKLQLAHCTSVLTLILWTMLFYWMRIFSQTSFYVLMITETAKSIVAFIFLFILCVASFANAVVIIDQEHKALAQEHFLDENSVDFESVMPEDTGNYVANAWLNQYLLGLGEFSSIENFGIDYNSSNLMWFYFISATLFTNVIFLNVLIAIVSDVYARIIESREKYGLQQKVQIYADFIHLVTLNHIISDNRYLYIIKPIKQTEAEQSEEWNGGIDSLKRQVARSHNNLSVKMQDQQRGLKKDMVIMNNQLDKVHDNIENVQETIGKLNNMILTIYDSVKK